MKIKLIYSKDLNLVNAPSRNLLFLRLNLFIGLFPGAKKSVPNSNKDLYQSVEK
jgi:hypothetical protein